MELDISPCLEPRPHGCPFALADKNMAPCATCAARKPFMPPREQCRPYPVGRRNGRKPWLWPNPDVLTDIVEMATKEGKSFMELARTYDCANTTISAIVNRRGAYADMQY